MEDGQQIEMKKISFILFLLFITPSHSIEFNGKFIQGHFITGKTEPGSKIIIGKKKLEFLKMVFCFWLDRDRKNDILITKISNGKEKP